MGNWIYVEGYEALKENEVCLDMYWHINVYGYVFLLLWKFPSIYKGRQNRV